MPLRINAPQLKSEAGTIDVATDAVDGELARLRTTVTTGHPWGTNEPGTDFAQLYTSLATDALQVLESRVGQLHDAAAGLRNTADDFVEAERSNRNRILRAGQHPGLRG